MQGEFGATDELTPGNFELCVAVDGRVQHWWRDNSALRAEAPRADYADPAFSDVAHQIVKASQVQTIDASQMRSDVAFLVNDESNLRVAKRARAARANAVVSAAPVNRWHQTAAFGHDIKHVRGLVQGSFGFNLDVVVETTDGALAALRPRRGDG